MCSASFIHPATGEDITREVRTREDVIAVFDETDRLSNESGHPSVAVECPSVGTSMFWARTSAGYLVDWIGPDGASLLPAPRGGIDTEIVTYSGFGEYTKTDASECIGRDLAIHLIAEFVSAGRPPLDLLHIADDDE